MPQEFHVLQCYSCFTFQVHQVKKSSNKWNCKLCGEKQSIKKVYGRGSGADCRRHVQNLNSLRQEADKIQTLSVCHYDNPELENKEQGLTTVPENQNRLPTYTESRWNQYIEEAPLEIRDEFPQPEDDMYTTDGSVFHRSKKRKRNTSSFSRKYTRHQNDIGADSTSYPSSYDKDLQGNDQPSISSSSSHRVQIFQQPQAFRFQSNPVLTNAKSSLQEFAHGDTTSFSSFTQLNVGPKEQFDALDTLNVKQRTAGNFPKLDPEKVKKRNPVQTIKTTGSKWDQFVEEDQDSLEDSEDEQENVCPVSNQGTSFQQRDNLPKYENRVNQELFSIDDLEDSDFQIYE